MQERVTIDPSGVITIPVNFREAYGLKPNDDLILETSDQGILVRPVASLPIETYSEARIAEFASEEQSLQNLLPRDR